MAVGVKLALRESHCIFEVFCDHAKKTRRSVQTLKIVGGQARLRDSSNTCSGTPFRRIGRDVEMGVAVQLASALLTCSRKIFI